MAKKIDQSTIEAIKQLLQQYNVKEDGQIIIDLKNNILTEYGETGISDLLGIRGTISNERAKEWMKELEEMREGW
jgi:anti-anti-sigma regulatory factor